MVSVPGNFTRSGTFAAVIRLPRCDVHLKKIFVRIRASLLQRCMRRCQNSGIAAVVLICFFYKIVCGGEQNSFRIISSSQTVMVLLFCLLVCFFLFFLFFLFFIIRCCS